MSARRIRTPGNLPQTRIYCDWVSARGDWCPGNSVPISGYDAREARKIAKSLGWGRKGGRDYCKQHTPEWAVQS